MAKDNGPKLDRAMQDKIGDELRTMYEELLKQPLPEKLTAPLQILAESRSLQQALAEPIDAIRPPTTSGAKKSQSRKRA